MIFKIKSYQLAVRTLHLHYKDQAVNAV